MNLLRNKEKRHLEDSYKAVRALIKKYNLEDDLAKKEIIMVNIKHLRCKIDAQQLSIACA